MRQIKHIVIHCSAGPASQSAEVIRQYHLSPPPRGRGWRAPGYHYVIEQDGRRVTLWPEERISNGVKGYNSHAVNICYTGGVDAAGRPADTRTAAQRTALRQLVAELRRRYPSARVCGHRDLSPDRNRDGRITEDEWLKACPCFDVATEL